MNLCTRTSGLTTSARSLAIVAGLLLAACKGKDGSDGTNGTSPELPFSPTSTELQAWEDAPGVDLDITAMTGATGPAGSFQSGDSVTVTFTAKKNDGTDWQLSELSGGRILVSGPTFNYQRVLAEASDLLTASVENADGTWSYTFADPIPATYLPPYHDSAAYDADDGELQGQPLQDGTYTVGLYACWQYSVSGAPYDDVGQSTKDFLYGGAATLDTREVVKSDNCNRCHTAMQAHDGRRRTVQLCVLCHTAGAEDDSGNGVSIDLRVMIHKMHDGKHLPSVLGVETKPDGTRDYAGTVTPYELIDEDGIAHDFSAVAFPVWPNLNISMPKDYGYSALTSGQKSLENTMLQGATECSKCHGDPDGAGPLVSPAQGDNHKTIMNRKACGSCHDDIDWSRPYVANQLTMPAQADDVDCMVCHDSSGAPTIGKPLPVDAAHLHPLNDAAVNQKVNFAVTAVTGGSGPGGNFAAGDAPALTFTVKNDAGADIPLGDLDSLTSMTVGPSTNRQLVFPVPSSTGASSAPPVDFSGRLAIASTSNRGSMSKVSAAAVSETLTVEFTSTTAFTVAGSVSGALGSSALAATPSTNPSGSSVSAVVVGPTAVAQTVAVAFSSQTAFAVTGSVSGAMGSGTMPATASASTRFTSTDGTLAFTITSGSTAFASGNTLYITLFQGAAANPVRFAIVAGTTSFAATDRFYYDTVAPAASYTFKTPMDIVLETLGDGNGAAGQLLAAANLPVYFGRQTLNERTALVGAATSLSAASPARDRFVVVTTIDPGLARNDYVVLDRGAGVAAEEHLQVGYVDSATKKIWFMTPLRFAHAGGASFQEATLTFRREGADYTLNAATGAITSVTAFGAGNAIVLNYRTDGHFGWFRSVGDGRQAVYAPPMADTPSLGQDWGEWQGLPFESGTYTASIWGYKTMYYAGQNEVQTYRATGVAANGDFLFGTATTLDPYDLIDTQENCNTCHDHVLLHGGGRSDLNTCVLCHGIAGAEDSNVYTGGSTDASPGVTVNFRTFLHKVHMGAELTFATTYSVSGNLYDEVEFPVLPGRAQNCTKCHGTATAWMLPASRTHSAQTTPTRSWRAACGSCHDSTSAAAHIDVMTSSSGAESCETCHGSAGDYPVELMHKAR